MGQKDSQKTLETKCECPGGGGGGGGGVLLWALV